MCGNELCLFHVSDCPCVLTLSACSHWSRSVWPVTFHPFYAIIADKNSKKKERETSNLFKLKVCEEKHFSLSYCLFDKTAVLCWGCHMTELTKQTKDMMHSGFQRSSPRTTTPVSCMKMGFKPLDLPTNLLHTCV